jgi:TPR repeat protein
MDGVKIDNKTAAKYYEKAGTPKAHYRHGILYLNGDIGKQKESDIAKGMELVSQAADEGYIDAIYTMGYCYETGRNVDSVDHNKAVSYFKQLADNDIASGQFKMGLYYELGDGGLEADSAKAIEYYRKAADQGHGEAM